MSARVVPPSAAERTSPAAAAGNVSAFGIRPLFMSVTAATALTVNPKKVTVHQGTATVTATVTSPAGTPRGSVEFSADGVVVVSSKDLAPSHPGGVVALRTEFDEREDPIVEIAAPDDYVPANLGRQIGYDVES